MKVAVHRKGRTLARWACYLLCAGALLRGTPAHAQAFKTLPDASEAISTKPPSPDVLFRVESEAAWRKRMVAEANQRKASAPIFPPEPVPESPFAGRAWPRQAVFAEPSYVCYGHLLFEQINAERYGWDLGPIHMLVSPAIFFLDVAVLPYNLAAHACCPCECSSGYCLPGSCVPLMLYPPELSASGAIAEAATIGLLLVIFP
jgi:hypothetical protein